MKLTLAKIKQLIAKDPRIDQKLDIDDDGDDIVVLIWTKYGWSWDAQEDRHVETFRIGSYETDTVAYLKERIKFIEADKNEAA